MKNLPKQERVRALQALGIWCRLELTGNEPPDHVLEHLGFDSIEAMRLQLENWGLPRDWFTEQKGRRPKATKAGGNKSELPPVVAARHLFEAGIERLQKVLGQLPLRKDYRQDGMIVSELSGPWLETEGQGAGRSSANEFGVTFILSQ
jgi:hypothetical protein